MKPPIPAQRILKTAQAHASGIAGLLTSVGVTAYAFKEGIKIAAQDPQALEQFNKSAYAAQRHAGH